ncbi:PrsW family intramembrane metalloprotease [Aeromicrobium sp.]|nr:PrsW family intramembrane metalloprotease [Candidatus Saccharibacteria bacterium]
MYFVIIAFIAIATSLVWYLLQHDHGRKLPVETLWYACGFGVLAMVLATVMELWLIPKGVVANPNAYPLLEQVISFLGIGFIEQAVKFVPLAIFIYKRDYFREHTDGCIYFAICGLTFGLGENILYTSSFGASVGLSRLILTPFFHAATTSILGYYLINRKLNANKTGLLAFACVVIPLLHGIYDFGLGNGPPMLQVLSLMLTLLLTMGLFLYFSQANLLDKLALARVPMGYIAASVFETAASRNFCDQCGQPNVNARTYCESCGHKL